MIDLLVSWPLVSGVVRMRCWIGGSLTCSEDSGEGPELFIGAGRCALHRRSQLDAAGCCWMLLHRNSYVLRASPSSLFTLRDE